MDDTTIRRIMPHSIEAEETVIGAMIMDRDAIVTSMEILQSDDFYQRQFGIIFESIIELFDAGIPVDLVTLQDKLLSKDVPPEIAGVEFLTKLTMAVPTTANVKYYADIVSEKAVLRRLIKTNDEVNTMCYAGQQELDGILDTAEKGVFKLMQRRGGEELTPIRTVVMNALDRIELVAKNKGNVTGIPTGFIHLDSKTAGLQPSDLVLVAARPSMGKTAFVLNIAQHVAFRQNMAVAIFSLEMSKEQLVNRLFALEGGIDAQKIRTGELSADDWERLMESSGVIGRSRLMIDDTPGITIQAMRSKCRKMKLEQGLDLVIIDYLQLMESIGRVESQQQKISDISRSLKGLARELNVPVIALSQLNRSLEKRDDKRPIMSDLRDSGAIEQDADVVMFIYRDEYYNKDSSEAKNVAEIIIAKQRNGPVGTVKLTWLPQYTRFANAEFKRNENA